MKSAVNDLLKTTIESLFTAFSGNDQSNAKPARSYLNNDGGIDQAGLANALTNILEVVITEALAGSKTSQTVRESARSTQQGQLKASHGQQQSQLTRELAQGRRNL